MKATARRHCTPTRMADVKKSNSSTCSRDARPSLGGVNGTATLDAPAVSSVVKSARWPSNSPSGHLPQRDRCLCPQKASTRVCRAACSSHPQARNEASVQQEGNRRTRGSSQGGMRGRSFTAFSKVRLNEVRPNREQAVGFRSPEVQGTPRCPWHSAGPTGNHELVWGGSAHPSGVWWGSPPFVMDPNHRGAGEGRGTSHALKVGHRHRTELFLGPFPAASLCHIRVPHSWAVSVSPHTVT